METQGSEQLLHISSNVYLFLGLTSLSLRNLPSDSTFLTRLLDRDQKKQPRVSIAVPRHDEEKSRDSKRGTIG